MSFALRAALMATFDDLRKMKKKITALFLLICASAWADQPTGIEKEIVGTWRFISVDGRDFPSEFYMKFNPDGTSKSWPSPHEGKFNTKDGISSGNYRIDDEFLYIVKEKGEDIKTPYKLANDSFTMTTDEGHVLVYRRLKSPLQPGELKADQDGVRQ